MTQKMHLMLLIEEIIEEIFDDLEKGEKYKWERIGNFYFFDCLAGTCKVEFEKINYTPQIENRMMLHAFSDLSKMPSLYNRSGANINYSIDDEYEQASKQPASELIKIISTIYEIIKDFISQTPDLDFLFIFSIGNTSKRETISKNAKISIYQAVIAKNIMKLPGWKYDMNHGLLVLRNAKI